MQIGAWNWCLPIAYSSYAARLTSSRQWAQFNHCVVQLGRKYALPHSFQVIASWVKTSNDSDSEAVCSNDGNYSSLQVQKLTQCFSSLLLYDFRKILEVGYISSIPLETTRAILYIFRITIHRSFISLQEKIQILLKSKLFWNVSLWFFSLGIVPLWFNIHIFLRVSHHLHTHTQYPTTCAL